MKFLSYCTLCLLVFCLTNCKNAGDSSENSEEVVREIIESGNPDVRDARERAQEKLVGTNKMGFYSELIGGYWHYEAVIKGTGPVEEFKGHYIQFLEDNTYSHGSYDAEISTGKWNYNPTSTELILLPDQQTEMPSEFRLMSKGNTVICVGTGTFRNNDTQMKWIKSDATPVIQ